VVILTDEQAAAGTDVDDAIPGRLR
jgi:hypothetical protein